MRYFFVLVASLLFAVSVFAQDDSVGFTNKAEATNRLVNGMREGKWMEYADPGDPIRISKDSNAPYYILTVYVHDTPSGMARMYYNPSGAIKMETPYNIHGKANGIRKEYFESGALLRATPYSNGKVNGTEHLYYESGKLKIVAPFAAGKLNGTEKEYYENGALESEIIYINGVAEKTKNYDEHGHEITY